MSKSLPSNKTYEPHFFDKLADVEDQHFWFRSRNKIIAALVLQLIQQFDTSYWALEVGCGTGNVLRVLETICADGHVIGMDIYIEGLRHAQQRTSCPLIQADMQRPPLQAQFHLIGMFDVLEHIPNDGAILESLWTMLVPEGRLLLTVPAHMSLWSHVDEAGRHCRRYIISEITEKLQHANFEVEFASYFMSALYPIAWLSRRMAKLFMRSKVGSQVAEEELRIVPVVNDILYALLAQESRILERRKSLPIGSSLIALASKKSP